MAINRTKVKGANALRRKLRAMPEVFNGELRKAIADGAEMVRQEMVSRAPVSPWWRGRGSQWWKIDTGHLRDNLEVSLTNRGLRARVGIVSQRARKLYFYARFLEFGTRFMLKRPFMWPAWVASAGIVKQNIEVAADKAFQTAARAKYSDYDLP